MLLKPVTIDSTPVTNVRFRLEPNLIGDGYYQSPSPFIFIGNGVRNVLLIYVFGTEYLIESG
jgi:hypothetical protein